MNDISFYFHIPFCIKKCDYCAFYSIPGADDLLKDEYAQAIIRQINHFPFERGQKITSVYFGGGTPPLIKTENILRILDALRKKADIGGDTEITVEVNPKTVSADDLKRLYAAGVNRLSVGVQSADDSVLKSIGRIHTFSDVERCFYDVREADFDNISADIIFALPYRGEMSFCDNIKRILSLGPKHISAYSLQLEEGTPLYKRKSDLKFPTEDEEEEQYGALCDILREGGFLHYEISSFAKENLFSKHNTGYWTGREYFGFGAAAHSFYKNKRFFAEPNVKSFIEKSRIDAFYPTNYAEADIISPEEAEEERILLGLRTCFGVELSGHRLSKAESIAKMGFGSIKNNIFSLNEKGFRVSNEIISEIITAE